DGGADLVGDVDALVGAAPARAVAGGEDAFGWFGDFSALGGFFGSAPRCFGAGGFLGGAAFGLGLGLGSRGFGGLARGFRAGGALPVDGFALLDLLLFGRRADRGFGGQQLDGRCAGAAVDASDVVVRGALAAAGGQRL